MIAPLYGTLFLNFLHIGRIVLKRVAHLALVLTSLISNKPTQDFFLYIKFTRFLLFDNCITLQRVNISELVGDEE